MKLQTGEGPFCVTCCYVTDLGLYMEIISHLQLLQRLLRSAASTRPCPLKIIILTMETQQKKKINKKISPVQLNCAK